MKKALLAISAAFVVSLSLSSCCKTCTKPGQNSVSVCRDNYDSDSDYNSAVGWYEVAGYSCN